MPANLGPDYLSAEEDLRHAQTPAERVAALEKMYAALPKHKGTEKLQADIKRRLSQTRKESQKKGPAHSAPFYVVPREGAGQVPLLGPANSGKSSLLRALTHAHPEVAEYPFTTRLPLPGMMKFEDAGIQLLDLPPIALEFTEPWMPQVLRNADPGVLVVDVNDPADLEEIEFIEQRLAEWRAPSPPLLIGNKIDVPGGEDNFAAIADLYGGRYRCLPVSATGLVGLPQFARAVFDMLALVRVYTKAPGKKAELDAPYILKRGATVIDAARHVHKDFAEHLRFARLFRLHGERDGLMVDRRHLLEDGDILEFHI
ncbi:MAG: 50S ribosome-binding GTPase [Acidobacteria bacterium]|nr:50S ribosome-binding GTPase [Acidobacteriota bacterium]